VRLDSVLQESKDGAALFFNVEPRVAGTWQLSDGPWGTLVRVAGAQTSRPADADEVAVLNKHGIALAPQRALQVQGGLEQGLSDGLSISSTVYAVWRDGLTTRAADFPVAVRDGLPPVLVGGTGRSVGAELLLRYASPTRAYGWLTYSLARHVRSDPADGPEGVVVDGETASPFDTTHILGLVGQVPLPWGFRAGARYRVASGMPDTPAQEGVFDADSGRYAPRTAPRASARLPIFQALDVRVDWSTVLPWAELTVYADLVNALNLRAQEGTLYSFDFAEQRPRLGLPIIPAIGAKATF
jgi:hypothetical protein